MRSLFPILLVPLLLSGCEGCTAGPLTETRAQPDVNPLKIDFGIVDVTQLTTRSFTLTNGGERTFDGLTLELAAASDPAFSLGSLPGQVLPGERVDVEVSVEPMLEASIAGQVLINGRVVDESGDEPHFASFTVDLTAVARNNGLPDIELLPADLLDFGRVGQGDVAFGDVLVRNVGVRDLRLEDMVLSPQAGAFSCRSNCALPQGTVLRPLETLSVGLAFSPPSVEDYEATLTFASNDPDEREVTVTLKGGGQTVPQCVLDLLDDVGDLEPQTTVRLDGSRSSTAVQGAYIKTYQWTASYRPPGSTTVLESQGAGLPRGVNLNVECPDPATLPANTPCSTRVDELADVAGTYEVTLVVLDSNDVPSAPCTARFRAIPQEALHVQLVWDHPTADLDLHFMRSTGPVFNHASDCYFSNRFPTWWGGDSADPRNPRLDVDDQGGFGPENVNVREPEPGPYRVAVHYWNSKTEGDPAALATLRVYVHGQLAMEQNHFFSQDQEMWTVADIDWPSDPEAQVTPSPIGTVEPYARPW
jgi:hypothetical protein